MKKFNGGTVLNVYENGDILTGNHNTWDTNFHYYTGVTNPHGTKLRLKTGEEFTTMLTTTYEEHHLIDMYDLDQYAYGDDMDDEEDFNRDFYVDPWHKVTPEELSMLAHKRIS